MHNDLVHYPPTISLIKALLDLKKQVVYIGKYSDPNGQKELECKGVEFVPIYMSNSDSSKFAVINHINLLKRMKDYERKMRVFFQSSAIDKDDIVWYMFSTSSLFMQDVLKDFRYIVHFYEFVDATNGKRWKNFYPQYNANLFLQHAKAVVHCEYNRSVICNALYQVNQSPLVLPNKPYGEETDKNLPSDVKEVVDRIGIITKGKRVIIYQGIFDPNERRLDEFCEAMKYLPDDCMFIAMGGGRGDYFNQIKQKYESDRIVFLNFIRPPYHLQITRIAQIGILTYFPFALSYVDVLNPLYCAPNKIFEYSLFGIPMIANEVPGLSMIFEQYNCGKIVSNPITPQAIAERISEVLNNYDTMSKGAKEYFDSVDVVDIVGNILNLATHD